MAIDDKIREEKLQYIINREAAKISSDKIDKYECLTSEEILPSNQRQIIEQATFTYSPLGKALEKQIKTIEDHGKQLVKSSSKRESLTLLKQKEIFEELANERINEIQNLSKQLILIIYFIILRVKVAQKMLLVLKVH